MPVASISLGVKGRLKATNLIAAVRGGRAAAGLRSGVVVDLSSISAVVTKDFADRESWAVHTSTPRYRAEGAREGTLTIMVGRRQAAVANHRDAPHRVAMFAGPNAAQLSDWQAKRRQVAVGMVCRRLMARIPSWSNGIRAKSE
jgi:hypothetical protein